MIRDGFRMTIAYDNEKQKFIARVPELDDLTVEGATRPEALQAAEAAIEKAFRQAADSGNEMPVPMDGREFDGKLEIQVSGSLHRELSILARQENVEIGALCGELLAAGIAQRQQGRFSRPNRDSRPREGFREGNRDGRRGRREGRGYFNVMDDKASFLEYVRSLDDPRRPPRRRGGERDE